MIPHPSATSSRHGRAAGGPALRLLLALTLVVACTQARTSAVFVRNGTLGVANVTTRWPNNERKDTLPQGQWAVVFQESYEGCSRDPHLGPEPIVITVELANGRSESYDRAAIQRLASWDRERLAWILTIGSLPTSDGAR